MYFAKVIESHKNGGVMRIANKMVLGGALALSLGAVSSPAGATLIFDNVQDLTGTGLGNVNTVLTIQSPGSNTTEQGCVGRIAGCPGGTASTTPSDPARVIGGTLGGNELTGDAQTKTILGSTVGTTSASDLRIVFNPQEPGAAAQQNITLNDLRLTIYNSDGSVQFTSGALPSPVNFADATGGVGLAGFFFRFDATQAAAAGTIDATDRIGLSALITNAQGGPETFFVTKANGGPTSSIPEPATVLLLGSGLIGLAAWRRVQRLS
jgi:hypothetical protein